MEDEIEKVPLDDAVTHMLEECRMVLPGLQALFGFQLVAVFQPTFSERLSRGEQLLHLVALALVAIAGALVMSPAAYHRQTQPRQASARFLVLGGRFLVSSMVPLMTAIVLDFYLIARVVIGAATPARAAAAFLLAVFVTCWFVVPRIRGKRAARTLQHSRG